MLSFFRTNQELSGFLLLPVIFAFLVPALWEAETPVLVSGYGPLGTWIYELGKSHPLLWVIVGGFFVFVIALMVNRLLIRHRLHQETNLFAGLCFTLLALFLPALTACLPLFVGNFFLILAIIEAFQIYKKTNAAGNIFNIGLWIGLAGLLYSGFYFHLLWGFAAINVMRTPNLREQLILLSGTGVALFLVGGWYFFVGQLPAFQEQFLNSFSLLDWPLPPGTNEWLILAGLGALLLIMLASYGSYNKKKGIQEQKKISLLYYLLLASGCSIFFQAGLDVEHLLVLLLPVSILLSMNLSVLERGPAEVVVILVILGMVWLHFGSMLTGSVQ